jgi:hypothetical protein
MSEFAHHNGFLSIFESGALSLIADHADMTAIAERLLAAARQGERTTPVIDYDAWWRATTAGVRAALIGRL